MLNNFTCQGERTSTLSGLSDSNTGIGRSEFLRRRNDVIDSELS